MFAISAPKDYVSSPPYIVAIEREEGLETWPCPSLAEAVVAYFINWCGTCRTHIVDARGAAIVALRPGGGLHGFVITAEVIKMISLIDPNADTLGIEMIDVERRVLLGEQL